jgi:hypothetical protein
MSNPTNYPYAPYQLYESDTNTPNLKAVLMRYVRYWKWFVLSLILAGAGAYVYTLYQTPIYEVKTSLLIKDDKKGLSEDNILKEMDIFAPKKVIENETEILKSYAMMDKVVGNLGLDVRYFRPTTTFNEEIYDQSPIRVLVEKATPELYETELSVTVADSQTVRINDVSYPINQSIQTPYGQLRIFSRQPLEAHPEPLLVEVAPRQVVVDGFLENLTVEPSSKASTVLLMSLEDNVPRRGKAVLNKLIDEYNQAAVVDKNILAVNTLKFIEDRLAPDCRRINNGRKGRRILQIGPGHHRPEFTGAGVFANGERE